MEVLLEQGADEGLRAPVRVRRRARDGRRQPPGTCKRKSPSAAPRAGSQHISIRSARRSN
jgi:hypothetical protein